MIQRKIGRIAALGKGQDFHPSHRRLCLSA
jgi:hypothetical protein